jgi:isopentenyl-diphosphate delta-isomerase
MPEQIVLIDENDVATGSADKIQAHRQGLLHRAFTIFVFNDKSQLLLQQRAMGKYHSGGLWTNTCCGHPRPGETTKDGAQRRLREEFGFTCALNKFSTFRYQTEFQNGLKENEITHLFFGRYNDKPQPDPLEIENWKWLSIDNLIQDIKRQPDNYTYWFKAIMNYADKLQVINKELSREAAE